MENYFKSETGQDLTVKIFLELEKIKKYSLMACKDVFDIKEASLFTGLSVSDIYKKCHRKTIPYHKAKEGGKNSYFSKKELTDWMLYHKIKTVEEIETDAISYKMKRGGVAV
jgi:predicted DNA-binding transcriptional regulator AlpA